MKNGRYRGVVSDLDGTLLGSGNVVSPRVYAAITRLMERGFFFSIATGRDFQAIARHCRELSLTAPQIIFGGAEIVTPDTGDVLHGEYLDPDVLRELIATLRKNRLSFFLQRESIAYSDPECACDFPFQPLTGFDYRDVPKLCLIAGHLDDAWTLDFMKSDIIDRYPEVHAVRSYGPGWKFWDITSAKATKRLAVERLAGLLRVETHEVVGIGDGHNDLPLLSACGYKVAIETAPEELKRLADFVAPSQAGDGVAIAIERVFQIP